MARYQYRLSGSLDRQASSGQAIFAIVNPADSGKKITIRSFECINQTATTTTGTFGNPSALTQPFIFQLGLQSGANFATIRDYSDPVVPTPFDTNFGAAPSTITVTKDSTVNPTPTQALRNFSFNKQMNSSLLSWMGRQGPTNLNSVYIVGGDVTSGSYPGTGIVLRQNEAITLAPKAGAGMTTYPLRVHATYTLSDGRSYSVGYIVNLKNSSQSIFTLENTDASLTVTLNRLFIEEVGTYDSPYYQIVPVGQVNADAASNAEASVSLLKMDTNYPTPASSWIKVYKNVPILPYGVPENYLADASAGSPKGFNYLKTKDFLGPVIRAYLPELEGTNNHPAPAATATMDNLGLAGHKYQDVGIIDSGIVLNEGDGIAIVSAAETATISFAIGVSGWSIWEFGAQIDIESKYSPTLTFTGLQPNSEVRVYRASDDTELAGIENSGTTFSFGYDWDGSDTEVYIMIHSLGYVSIRFPSIILGKDGLTIPVQQQFDRQYSNPA